MILDQKLSPSAALTTSTHLRLEANKLQKAADAYDVLFAIGVAIESMAPELRMKAQDYLTIAKFLDTQITTYYASLNQVKEQPEEETSDICPKCASNPTALGYDKFDCVVVTIRFQKDPNQLVRIVFSGPEVEKKQNWNNVQWAMSALYRHASETGNHYELKDTKVIRINRSYGAHIPNI